MKETPLVSVIVVNYNFEKFILTTLESIRSQQFSDFELIIIDDHSKDKSVSLIENWMSSYDKDARLIRNESNLGVCATLNRAFHAARGKYIAATAGDDEWLPEKLERQVKIMEGSSADTCLVYSDALMIDEIGNLKPEKFIQTRNVKGAPKGNIFEDLLTDNFIPAMSVLLRRECFEAVGDFDSRLPYEDYDMWLRLAASYKFAFSEYISVKYRVRKNSLSKTIDWDIPNAKILLKHLNTHPLVLTRLREIGLRAYQHRKSEVFRILAGSIHDPYIARAAKLYKLRVPSKLGMKWLTARNVEG